MRTPYGEPRYLHLRISPNAIPAASTDFLFTDVSGESFERARDSVSECQRLGFLKRADHFLLLLDGEKLAQPSKRWGVAHATMGLLQTCLDAKMLLPHTNVTVVSTKIDFVLVSAPPPGDTFPADMRAEFESRFKARVKNLQFAQIASRPTEAGANLQFGHGLADLLQQWTTSAPREKHVPLINMQNAGTRESEQFGVRHFTVVNAPT